MAAEGWTPPVSVRSSNPTQGFVSRDMLGFPRTPLGFSKPEGKLLDLEAPFFSFRGFARRPPPGRFKRQANSVQGGL